MAERYGRNWIIYLSSLAMSANFLVYNLIPDSIDNNLMYILLTIISFVQGIWYAATQAVSAVVKKFIYLLKNLLNLNLLFCNN